MGTLSSHRVSQTLMASAPTLTAVTVHQLFPRFYGRNARQRGVDILRSPRYTSSVAIQGKGSALVTQQGRCQPASELSNSSRSRCTASRPAARSLTSASFLPWKCDPISRLFSNLEKDIDVRTPTSTSTIRGLLSHRLQATCTARRARAAAWPNAGTATPSTKAVLLSVVCRLPRC